jgi:sugar phosphate isomerase/epimerase
MQLGIFAKTFPRPSVEGVFDAVAAVGLRCVQFNFACAGLPSLPQSVEPAVLERIRKAAAARDVFIAAVSGTFNMIHPDANQRREGLRRLAVVADAAHALGAPLVTLCTGTRDPLDMWRQHAANTTPEAWRDLRASMAEALEIAERHRVVFGVEPETANVVNSARAARRLLDEMKSPRLKIVMDAANLFHPADLPRMREVLDEAFDLLGQDIALAHAKELRQDGQAGDLPLGAGVLDWDRYLTRLSGAGFVGPLIIHGIAEAKVGPSVEFLKSKLEVLALRSRRR